ncbi:MAG: hypothetical protein O2809_00850 [Proteobacteria bacterium]|nr:hypothetical protein [Pseudomonadota bacterium]
MASAFDIQVLGSGHMYVSLLQNISTVMLHSNLYNAFICIMLFLGFYSFVFAAAKHGGISVQAVMQKFLACVILIYIMTKVSVNVLIIDEFDAKQTQAVPDVPLILALPEWFVHKIGFYGAEIIGELSSKSGFMPTDLTPTSGVPLSIAPAMIADASQYEIADPIFKASLSRYMLDCILPNKNFNVGNLYTSGTLWNDIKDMQPNKALSTVWFGDSGTPNTTGEVLSCGDAQKKIAPVMAQLSNKVTDDFIKQSTVSIAPNVFQSIIQYYGGQGATGSDMILQSSMIGMLNTTIPEAMIASSKSQVLYDQLASQRAAKQAFSSWSIEASSFSSTFGYLLVVIDVLGIVLGIIVFPFVFVPFFFSLVRNYLMLLAFIPLATIGLAVAAVIGTYANKGSLAMLDGGGLTLSNHMAVTQAAIKAYQSIYIYQYMSVTVAAGLAFGMTFIGSRIMSGGNAMEYAKQNAAQAAQSSYTGADTRSMANDTMNKHNIATETLAGVSSYKQSHTGGNPLIDYQGGGVQTSSNGAMIRNQTTTTTTSTHSDNSGVTNTVNNDTSHSDKYSTGQTISQSLASNEAIKTALSGKGLRGAGLSAAYDGWSAMTDNMPDMVPSMVKDQMASQIKSGVSDTLKADEYGQMANQAKLDGNTQLYDQYSQTSQEYKTSAQDHYADAVKTGEAAKASNSDLSGWDVAKEVAVGAGTLIAGAAIDAAGVVGEVGTLGAATPLVAGAEIAGTSMIAAGAGKIMQYGGRLASEATGLMTGAMEKLGLKGASKSVTEGMESTIARQTHTFDEAKGTWIKDSARVRDLKNETVGHGERFDVKQYEKDLADAQKGGWQRFKESRAGKVAGGLMKEFNNGYEESWGGTTYSQLDTKNQQQHNVSDDRTRRFGAGYSQGSSDSITTTSTTTSTVQMPTYPSQGKTALQLAQENYDRTFGNQVATGDIMNDQRDTSDYGKHQQSFDGNSDKVKEKLNDRAGSAWQVRKVDKMSD